MKQNELYAIRIAKPIDGSSLFYVAGDDITSAISKFCTNHIGVEIVKVMYEGQIYV